MKPERAQSILQGHTAFRTIVALAALLAGVVAALELLKIARGR